MKKKHKIIITFFIIITLVVGVKKYKELVDRKNSVIEREMMNHYFELYDASLSFDHYLNSNNSLSLLKTIERLYSSSISYEKVYHLKNPYDFSYSEVLIIIKDLSDEMIYLSGEEKDQDNLDALRQINEFLAKWVEWIEEEHSSGLNDTKIYKYYESLDFSAPTDKLFSPRLRRFFNHKEINNR